MQVMLLGMLIWSMRKVRERREQLTAQLDQLERESARGLLRKEEGGGRRAHPDPGGAARAKADAAAAIAVLGDDGGGGGGGDALLSSLRRLVCGDDRSGNLEGGDAEAGLSKAVPH